MINRIIFDKDFEEGEHKFIIDNNVFCTPEAIVAHYELQNNIGRVNLIRCYKFYQLLTKMCKLQVSIPSK